MIFFSIEKLLPLLLFSRGTASLHRGENTESRFEIKRNEGSPLHERVSNTGEARSFLP